MGERGRKWYHGKDETLAKRIKAQDHNVQGILCLVLTTLQDNDDGMSINKSF